MSPARSDYRVVRYEPSLREALIGLERMLWSPDPAVCASYLDWKYHENPYASEVHLYLAMRGADAVAARGMYGSRWEYGRPARRLDALCRADTVIHPDHRGRGILAIFEEVILSDLAGRGYPFLFGTSAAPPVAKAARDAGWRSVGPFQRAWRDGPGGTTRTARDRPGLVTRLFGLRQRASSSESHPFTRLDTADLAPCVVEASPRPAEMADLVAAIPSDGRIRHVRDAEYLAWRFRNPLSDYRFVYLEGERLEGYAVLQASRTDPHRAGVRVVDWEAVSDAHAHTLIEAVAAEAQGRVTITTTSLPPERRRGLIHAGFVDEPPPEGDPDLLPGVIVRSTRTGEGPGEWRLGRLPLVDPGSWEWRDLYSDDY